MDILVFLVFIIVTLYLYEKYKLKFKLEFRFVFVILLLCLFVYDPSLIKDFITMFYDTNTTHPSKISTIKINTKNLNILLIFFIDSVLCHKIFNIHSFES